MPRSEQRHVLQTGNRLFVRLRRDNQNYFCQISDRRSNINLDKFKVDLSPDAEIEPGLSLGKSIEMLRGGDVTAMNNFFSLPNQVGIGNYLYQQIFDKWLNRQPGQRISTDICIISEDPYLNQIPWVLLADNGIFLSSTGWRIFLSPFTPNQSITFGAFPRTLIILPNPDSDPWPDTRASDHLEQLKNLLQSVADDLVSDFYLRVITTWQELEAAAKDFQPNVIYYYGHGEFEKSVSRLIFQDPKKGFMSKSVIDFARQLQQFPAAPHIVYLNCCSGDTAGWLGAGNQLSELVPAVIANRTTAYAKSSQDIALGFLVDVLKNNRDPIRALHHSTARQSQESIRSISPVCYANFEHWESMPTKVEPIRQRDSDWLITLDRTEQCERLIYNILEMIKYKKPRSLGFFWYGENGEGIDLFHQRFRKEISKHLREISLKDKTVEWPAITQDIVKSFEELFCQTFEIKELNLLQGRFSTIQPHVSGRTRIFLIDHPPFDIESAGNHMTPQILSTYLQWVANRLLHCFPKDVYILLGMSFIVPPDKWERFEEKTETVLQDAQTDQFVPLFLPRLKKLKSSDLSKFIRTHEIPIDGRKMSQVIKKVLEETGGNYEKTIEILKDIEHNWFLYIDKAPVIDNSDW